jgi:hypothetical protein
MMTVTYIEQILSVDTPFVIHIWQVLWNKWMGFSHFKDLLCSKFGKHLYLHHLYLGIVETLLPI